MYNNGQFHTVRGYEILDKSKRVLTNSMEDYLEMIYRYSIKEGYTRINTLADAFLDYKKYGIIQLTKDGERIGKFLLNRHRIIEDFLKIIGVEENLLVNTELIEHNVTTGALSKIEMLNSFFRSNPDIMDKFNEYRSKFLK